VEESGVTEGFSGFQQRTFLSHRGKFAINHMYFDGHIQGETTSPPQND
jgi:hypothetical protein